MDKEIICNTKRVKKIDSNDVIFSDIEMIDCEQKLDDADMLDFMTDMDNLSFYEKTSWNKCEDLIYVKNEEALWQTIVGEIKTPYGVLNNSIGQAQYGCRIWDYIGETIDSLNVQSIEYEVIQVCLKYPEVNNVINIETYAGDDNSLLINVTLDTIYDVFDGHLRIPTAYTPNKHWNKNSEKYFS